MMDKTFRALPGACDSPALDLLQVAALAGEGTAWVWVYPGGKFCI